MFGSGRPPEAIIAEKNLLQISDSRALEGIIAEVIKGNHRAIADYKNGKASALMFLVGQVMKRSRGKANPNVAAEMLKEVLQDQGG